MSALFFIFLFFLKLDYVLRTRDSENEMDMHVVLLQVGVSYTYMIHHARERDGGFLKQRKREY